MTIDTNILIAYLGGDELVIAPIKNWRRSQVNLFISSVTECEILSYPKLTFIEEERIERFLRENFIAIPFDGVMARRAAVIRRITPNLKLPDAAIAALALATNTPLLTRNLHDFRKVDGLKVTTL